MAARTCGIYQYTEVYFALEPLCGKWDVTFGFLPGSCFDFESFRFYS